MKIVHIIKTLNPGGVETWLKDLSYNNKNELHYLLHDMVYGFYEDEIIKNGVIVDKKCLKTSRIGYMIYLFKYLRSNNIDVIHSHVNLSSCWFLLIGLFAGVKIRVAHCHNDKRLEYKSLNIHKKIYNIITKILLCFVSNRKISVSYECSSSMFYSFSKVNIIPCGLRFNRDFKSKLRYLSNSKKINVYHVGRFVNQKNHSFIIDLAERCNDNVDFFLIGEGILKNSIINTAKLRGLSNVHFLGLKDNILTLLNNNADLFILPSKFEGLGLAAVESQISLTHTVVSSEVPSDVKISSFIDFYSLNDIDLWVDRINNFRPNIKLYDDKLIDFFKFSIEKNTLEINKVYSS